jgi:hypothetical protein
MKAIALICVLTLGRCLASALDTNSLASGQIFSLPSLDLRGASVAASKPTDDSILSEKATSLQQSADLTPDRHPADFTQSETRPGWRDQYSLSTHMSELDMEVYKRLDEGGYLRRPEPETTIGHFMERTFSPEIIHLGNRSSKAFASCTLYTAIKRKNPLCLLNPMFLFVSR